MSDNSGSSGSPGGKKLKDAAGAPKKAKAPKKAPKRKHTGEQAGTSAAGTSGAGTSGAGTSGAGTSANPEQQQPPPGAEHPMHSTPAETDLYKRQQKEGRKRK